MRARSKAIDQQLIDDAKTRLEEAQKYKKIILLGSGDSGKTTLLKQLKILYSTGFSKDELESYKEAAQDNVFESVNSLVNGMRSLDLIPNDQAIVLDMTTFEDYTREKGSSLPGSLVESAVRIWRCTEAQAAFARRNEFLIQDTAKYFITNAKRLTSEDFVPTQDECLLIRIVTTSISVTRMSVKNQGIDVIDVGGHRNFRFRWAPYLTGDLTCIFFITSVACYDQMLAENKKVSRMEDAIALFRTICKSRLLLGVPLMIFLNKVDLLEEKITKSPIEKYFTDFKRIQIVNVATPGQNPVKMALSFFGKKFDIPNKNPPDRVTYHHVTCATDTKLMRTVLAVVTNSILQQAMQSIGIG